MRGSGLSIERFVKGKTQRSKSDAKSKKKAIIHKAQRRRQYDKVKKREEIASVGSVGDPGAGASFYDRFFSELTTGNVDEGVEKVEVHATPKHQEQDERKHMVKPDPFYKAKKKATITKMEKQRGREEKQKRIAAGETKVTKRKKRHVKLSQRTATGQPVVKNHINDILSRLQAEKKREET